MNSLPLLEVNVLRRCNLFEGFLPLLNRSRVHIKEGAELRLYYAALHRGDSLLSARVGPAAGRRALPVHSRQVNRAKFDQVFILRADLGF